MAKFSVINFRKETAKSRNSLKNIAYNAALAKLNGARNGMLQEFNDHDVTKEIEQGPDGQNISNTLGGRGNLFSFIGFNAGEKPTDVVKQALRGFGELDRIPVIEEKGSVVRFKFLVKSATLQSLYESTPLPWESGKSWLEGIEKGISGLGHYIYWKVLPNPPSRSGTGVQAKNLLRSASFVARSGSYMSKILNNFYQRLSK